MPFDRFLISPINTGLQTDTKPWQVLDDAFTYLQNAYVFRGRVRKRFGSLLMGTTPLQSQLRISLGANTNAAIALPANTAAHTPQLALGQLFSLGADTFEVFQLGAGVSTLSTNVGVTAVIDSVATPNTITFTGGALVTVFWYPSLPVMGITQYESGAVNNHPTYAFDTEFAYTFTGSPGAWTRSGTAVWKGSNLNYFWTSNWQGIPGTVVMFVTNFNATVPAPGATDDPIWYFDGTTWTAASGANAFYFLPAGGAIHTGAFVSTARIIVPFRNRLVLLNTVENDGAGVTSAHVQRARYSFNGSPFARNAWYEPNQFDSSGGVINQNNIAAGSSFVDASTEEQIISAEFIKDRLIVYFERSTWELAYTGYEIEPFVWNKLNTELGSQSTFSTIPFDKEVLTIGNTGVHGCNGSNVVRIDDKIPDEIFEFESKANGNLRTVGIRDYYGELAIWTFVSDLEEPTQTFPNQLLIYNYKNESWALFDDCFTFWGYFEQQSDTTWASTVPQTWEQANYTWNFGVIQSNQRQIIGGNQQGYVLRLSNDSSRNAAGMNITNMSFAVTGIVTLKIYNHNLSATPSEFPADQDFIYFENIVADATTMAFMNNTIFPVFSVVDANTITVNTFGGLTAGTYLGGGTVARVSNIQITTKQFNPYVDQDRNVYIQRVDFGVGSTTFGQITVDYFPSSSNVSMIADGVQSGAIMGNSVLETTPYATVPLEAYQTLLWHPLYFQCQGQFVQFSIYLNPNQMVNPSIAFSDFELQGMVLYTQPTNARLS